MDIVLIDVTKDISDGLYYKVIDFAVGRYPLFLFVKRKDVTPELNADGEKVVQAFSPFLQNMVKSKEWPGTRVVKAGDVFYYNLTLESAELLKLQSNSLYKWQCPALPEDMCIMRNSTQPWLCNIAHENMAMFYISPSEKKELLKDIPELSSYLGEERKPSAYY